MMIEIKCAFAIGSIVYLVTDPLQEEYMVCAYKVTQTDVLYILASGTSTSTHYAFELSENKKV